MRFAFSNKNRDRKQFDWIEEYFGEPEILEPSPYLWTRIKAHIPSLKRSKEFAPTWGSRLRLRADWAFSLIMIISVSFGFLVGKQLSIDYHIQTKPAPIQSLNSSDELDIDPLSLERNHQNLGSLDDIHAIETGNE